MRIPEFQWPKCKRCGQGCEVYLSVLTEKWIAMCSKGCIQTKGHSTGYNALKSFQKKNKQLKGI